VATGNATTRLSNPRCWSAACSTTSSSTPKRLVHRSIRRGGCRSHLPSSSHCHLHQKELIHRGGRPELFSDFRRFHWRGGCGAPEGHQGVVGDPGPLGEEDALRGDRPGGRQEGGERAQERHQGHLLLRRDAAGTGGEQDHRGRRAAAERHQGGCARLVEGGLRLRAGVGDRHWQDGHYAAGGGDPQLDSGLSLSDRP
jgi:hypothetical protein